jgi:hypothetical protein
MSAVIEFPAGRIRQTAQQDITGSAEVIIFPGVRVERLAFDLAERLPVLRNGSASKVRASDFDFY